jgi:methyltransferase (TIGR00027 family)
MNRAEIPIQHVSDTALWVALYRAEETERTDSLFQDPFARKLMGPRGEKIAASMKASSPYTRQNVVIRTYIIDRFIQKLVADGVDTVINLGAGLDTRPYRLELPPTLRWIEVDYPSIIEMKSVALRADLPRVKLERVALDLSKRDERQSLFKRLGSESRKAIILTEGVVPYLFEADVATLAEDLAAHPTFQFWITDYISSEAYKYLKDAKRTEKMKNAPFRFFPAGYIEFYKALGWSVGEIEYIEKISTTLGRPIPMPWWAWALRSFMPTKVKARISQLSGYMILSHST